MQFTKTLLFLSAAMATTAFTIPKGEASGFYLAYYDIEGKEVHKLITAFTDTTPNPANEERSLFPSVKFGKRNALIADDTVWCGCRNGVDHTNTDHVTSHMWDVVGLGYSVGPNNAVYTTDGSAVAFFCNKDNFSATVNQGMVPTGGQKITAACGQFIAGTWRVDGLPAMDYGYMDWFDGEDFCHNAEGSASHSC